VQNEWQQWAEMAAFLIVGNGLVLVLPLTKGFAATESLFCPGVDPIALCDGIVGSA
jgi:hypothetical protein